MPTSLVARRLIRISVTVAAALFAVVVVADTLRAVVPAWSALPWMDEWATVELLRAFQAGEMSARELLFSQHNEHRILVPRLVFFADEALFSGQGRLSLCAIFAVQALHAGLFALLILQARPPWPGRWALAAVVLAMMFSLRQAENFTYGFQVQFVGVFAGASLCFVLFGLTVARARAGRAAWPPLVGCFAAVLATTLTMANGLAAAFILVPLALLARLRPWVGIAAAAWAVTLALVYFDGYEPVAHHSHPSESLRHPLALLAYVAAYLGSLWTSGEIAVAVSLGAVGILATLVAVLRAARQPATPPAALALVGVMLFVGAAAAVTASGRLGFGIGQALSSRYATGSAAFWAAQLSYWWIHPPRPARLLPRRWAEVAARGTVAVAAAALCRVIAVEQRAARPAMAEQSFALADGTDLALLGLHDPAVLGRIAWVPDEAERLLQVLSANAISIYDLPEARLIGRPLGRRDGDGPVASCAGRVDAAADPSLGRDGARLSGVSGPEATDHRVVRRVLLVDAGGTVVGLGAGAIPGAPRGAWRGYAVAPAGARLTAFGRRGGDDLCRIGEATVSAPPEPGPAP